MTLNKPHTAAVSTAKSAASALMSPVGALFAKVIVTSAVQCWYLHCWRRRLPLLRLHTVTTTFRYCYSRQLDSSGTHCPLGQSTSVSLHLLALSHSSAPSSQQSMQSPNDELKQLMNLIKIITNTYSRHHIGTTHWCTVHCGTWKNSLDRKWVNSRWPSGRWPFQCCYCWSGYLRLQVLLHPLIRCFYLVRRALCWWVRARCPLSWLPRRCTCPGRQR